ncbi:MAG: hypothetical protein KAX19_13260 [Candidatus Brocadiae bacterium]|nr:hypothetical protein [Candidatus Brocadiia bacterium]
MDARVKRNVVVGIVGIVAACAVLYMILHKNPYASSRAAADSEQVQRALEILRSIAAEPDGADRYMSADATERARAAVAEAAEMMGEADSVELKDDAAWFGEYLRVGVTCPRGEEEPLERYFFLTRERGELRITGPAL